ncbi:hypothetical protein CPC08DRAFT_705990 [Agrocybe pediades]|nr:hypothetical protein CPC08DRAFT_705990 [Agrocybe pediades]
MQAIAIRASTSADATVNAPEPQQRPIPPALVSIPKDVPYWGPMYDMQGNKIGQTYSGADKDSSVAYVQMDRGVSSRHRRPQHEASHAHALSSPPPEEHDARPMKKRVFIGAIQKSWDVPRRAKVKPLHPLARRQSKRDRLFVGSERFLEYDIPEGFWDEDYDDYSEEEDEEEGQFEADKPDCIYGASPLTTLPDTSDDDDEADGGGPKPQPTRSTRSVSPKMMLQELFS